MNLCGLRDLRVALPGVLVLSGWKYEEQDEERGLRELLNLPTDHPLNAFPLLVVVDDAEFSAATLNNFLWTTFTRSDPASDLLGIGAFTEAKHWGCRGSLLIDARVKPHHAPPLLEDPEVTRSVDALAAPGGPLHGIY